ncbi:hypothetical protein CCAX7_25620 [Capsulimonas corticalis]|uniref:Glycoside hydrolase family 44 catalytic domain-containing protein n=1 Tax=Capsulimonas corticalis TaxID=2219043 RepID=A0A402CVU5_9BACT|nr:glycoside hydrolase family 44 protein [Capsulimonas corticalis]BDI30511.1 hypothetical protein CCAX7_25620 [Capsulimonas corticalis]
MPFYSSATTILLAAYILTGQPGQAQTADPAGTLTIYDDAYQNGWSFGGWAGSVRPDSPDPVHAGKDAISVSAGPYEALSLRHAAFETTPYQAVSFWLRAKPETKLKIQALLGDKAQPQPEVTLAAPSGDLWRRYVVPLKTLGADARPDMVGFWIQDAGGKGAVFAVDDLALVTSAAGDGATEAGMPPPPQAVLPAVTVTVDALLGRHPISPGIYGVNFAGPEHALLRIPFNRNGGDTETRYNWKQNAHSIGNDWYYESVPVGDAVPGKQTDDFIATSKAIGAQSMVTIPLIGWVAKLGPNRDKLASFSVAKYGAQKEVDTKDMPDAGKGVKLDGSKITGNDPNDASTPSDPEFMRGWVQHLVAKWGRADKGGVRYYLMDNEPNIWHLTHHDVDPAGIGMDEYRDRLFAYAAMVKSVDPTALVVGPESWDFLGAKYSDADILQASRGGDWKVMPDRHAHGDQDFYPWILDQLRAYEKKTGHRLVDVASFHYYPQDGNSADVSTETQLKRNRNTRSLWDPTYKAESWVNDIIDMLPRMKTLVKEHYPGLKLAYTEYNWGADDFLNGATAQADVLGILGREGIDIATRFCAPIPGTPVFHAFQIYRNYDGRGGSFGTTSLQTKTPNPDTLAAFSAQRADGAVTVMVVNKVLTGRTPLTLRLDHVKASGPAQVWQLNSRNVIERLADAPCRAGQVAAVLPAQSISLFVIPSRPASK